MLKYNTNLKASKTEKMRKDGRSFSLLYQLRYRLSWEET